MKVYVITFNPTVIPTHELLNYFDTRSEILNWYTPYAGTIFVVSNHNETALSSLIHAKYSLSPFFVAAASTLSVDGRLPKIGWDFINEPKSSGRWDAIPQTGILGLLGGDNQEKKKV